MGRIDSIAREFVKKPDVFADLCNYTVYGGRQVIKPEDLKQLSRNPVSFS